MRLLPSFLAFALVLGLPLLAAVGADYTVTNSGGVITVTNNTTNADTLTVSQQIVGSVTDIVFSASGRSFSLNGGANNMGGTLVSLSGVTAITINGGSGGETFSVGGFSGPSFPSLTIIGGVGNDTVNFTGNITFAANNSLTVNLQTGSGSPGADAINVSNAVQLVASGNGTIDLECSKSIAITAGAAVQTANGNLTVMANQQTAATTGNFTGVQMDGTGTLLKVTGFGALTVSGRGGNDAGGSQLGVNVSGGAQIISSGAGNVKVTGTGGASTGQINRGVTVYGAGSAINTTGGGRVTVTGSAGAQGSNYGIGVSVLYGGKISGNGDYMFVTGTGGGVSGGSSNQGVEIGGAVSGSTSPSTITSASSVLVTAAAGPGASVGLTVSDAASIGSVPGVSIDADSISLNDTASITATSASSSIQISTLSATTNIDLGGANAPGTLGLSTTELGQMKTPTLVFGGSGAYGITISQPITRSNKTDFYFYPGPAGVFATASGTDLNLDGGTLYIVFGTLNIPIVGPTADTNFPQLHVNGGVNIGRNGPVTLNLAGTTYGGSAGQTFTILKNDGGNAITGTFQNLPEGAYLPWPGNSPGNPALAAQISYVGGTGHDVVLTLVPVAQALTVNSTANDTSVGSLQAAINFAAANPGADTVTFAPALSGQTITLSGPANGYAIPVGDSAGVTLDASSLSAGLTIAGGGSGGNFGLFQVYPSASLTLRGLTLANGGGSAFASAGELGGAISSIGTLTLIGCTLSGNSAEAGGAIVNSGTLTLIQCTLTGNAATVSGGAIESGTALTVEQCTISGNSSGGAGGGIFSADSTFTLANSIVAGNTGPDILFEGRSLSLAGTNLVQVIQPPVSGSGTVISAAPVLAPLGSYGGPTQTMPPLPGSPAIDRCSILSIPLDPATNMALATDQRGFPRIAGSMVDIGPVETSALVVMNAADDGSPGSLRQRIAAATDITTTLTFAPALSG